jgi:cytochrome P450
LTLDTTPAAETGSRGGPAIIPIEEASYWQDPHSILRAARERHPVALASTGEPIILRYADVERLASDHKIISNALAFIEGQVASGPLVDWWRLMLTNLNGPDHRRLRSLVNRAFTPRSAEQKRGRIRSLTRELVERHFEAGRFDVIDDFSHELPIRLICETLGVPAEHQEAFSVWSTDLGSALSSVLTPELQARGEAAARDLSDAVRDLLRLRRKRPAEDLLSDLIRAAAELDDPFSDEDLVVLVINLIFGGHDSSRSMLAIAIALLVKNPSELKRLRGDPGLAASAGEEVLRFEPIVPVLARESTVDFELEGVEIKAGQPFWLSVLASNRDPAAFPDPDRFDVAREGAHSFSFGWGAHRCLGAAFALAEIQEAIPAFFECVKNVELGVDEPKWVPFANLRRLEALPISFEPVLERAR